MSGRNDILAQRIAERVRGLRKTNKLIPIPRAVQIILNTGHYPEGTFSKVCSILGGHNKQSKKNIIDLPLWRKS